MLDDAKFEDYLLEEYSHIADAHFKTNEMMSAFFKHYIAIMTIPIAITAYIISQRAGSSQPNEIIKYITAYGGPLLIVISVVGFAVMLHITNLRLDSLLYARTINGIRKFFYDNAAIDINTKLRMRTLPQTTLLPAYFETWYLLPVISAFALINSSYLCAGLWFSPPFLNLLCIKTTLSIFFSSAALHFFAYWRFSKHRETGYLKSNAIGIDIDGVMNKHREHFCLLLKQKTGDIIEPDHITHIPVHEAGLSVTRQDALKVFNDPKYWIDMPLETDAPEILKKLRNVFKFKIFIFTHRPWPNIETAEEDDKKATINTWRTALHAYETKVFWSLSEKQQTRWSDYCFQLCLNPLRRNNLVQRLTILWLLYYKFEYNKLIIEKGNEDTTDPRGNFHNRFQFSRKKRFKFFVEDDLEKAIKLAFICDVIFLFDHPYNKEWKMKIPITSNIIRVKSWNEIYQYIRRLS